MKTSPTPDFWLPLSIALFLIVLCFLICLIVSAYRERFAKKPLELDEGYRRLLISGHAQPQNKDELEWLQNYHYSKGTTYFYIDAKKVK